MTQIVERIGVPWLSGAVENWEQVGGESKNSA